MTEAEAGSLGLPGTWWPLQTPDGRSATFVCPKCGLKGALDDHVIASDGQVTPSVQCLGDCEFHDNVRLLGWTAER